MRSFAPSPAWFDKLTMTIQACHPEPVEGAPWGGRVRGIFK